ncbi:MAG: hypothetical protein ACRC50_08845 [Gaiella sp.]
MASLRDARRSLDRDDVDEAMVVLWNALEPLRLAGDQDGLEEAARLAARAAAADPAYASEAERVRIAVGALTAGPADAAVVVPQRERTLVETLEKWAETVVTATGAGEPGMPEPVSGAPPSDAGSADDEAGRGRRLGPLVWALLAGLFLLLNVLGNLFGDG